MKSCGILVEKQENGNIIITKIAHRDKRNPRRRSRFRCTQRRVISPPKEILITNVTGSPGDSGRRLCVRKNPRVKSHACQPAPILLLSASRARRRRNTCSGITITG